MSDNIRQLHTVDNGVSRTSDDFAEWLERYAAYVRENQVPLKSLYLIGESIHGKLGFMNTSASYAADRATHVGIMTMAVDMALHRSGDERYGFMLDGDESVT